MSALLQGILLGLSISVLLGPILFLFIDATLQKGFKGAFALGMGAWTSDILYILISYNALSQISFLTDNESFKSTVGILGGVLLVGLGIAIYRNAENQPNTLKPKVALPSKLSRLYLKGFLINTLNPFAFIIWVTSITSLLAMGHSGLSHISAFMLGSMGVIILSDILKMYLAERLLTMLTQKHQIKLKRFAGIGLIALGVLLIIRVI